MLKLGTSVYNVWDLILQLVVPDPTTYCTSSRGVERAQPENAGLARVCLVLPRVEPARCFELELVMGLAQLVP